MLKSISDFFNSLRASPVMIFLILLLLCCGTFMVLGIIGAIKSRKSKKEN
jgi:phosphotransferase system  glucose/maltose/N-acetylglucosamine-specific IIC component